MSPFARFHTKDTLKERKFFDQPATPIEHCPYKSYVNPCPESLRRNWLDNWNAFHKKK
jgi:hypothetical protein